MSNVMAALNLKIRIVARYICVIYIYHDSEVYMQNINLQKGSFKKYHPRAKTMIYKTHNIINEIHSPNIPMRTGRSI